MLWLKGLLIWGPILVAVWLATAEYARHSARAGVEREMFARFERLVCPPEEVNGDVCGDDVNLGRCVTGDYIDYRTIWNRVTTQRQVMDLLVSEYNTGHTPQSFVNWLACQGFAQPQSFPDGWSNSDLPQIHFFSYYQHGFGPFGYPTWHFPLGALRAPYVSAVRLDMTADAGRINRMGMSHQQGTFER